MKTEKVCREGASKRGDGQLEKGRRGGLGRGRVERGGSEKNKAQIRHNEAVIFRANLKH